MHGSVFYGFKQFVVGRDGKEVWQAVVRSAGAGGWYFPTNSYPDEELQALVTSAAAAEGRAVGEVWEEFGAAVVPNLLTVYRSYLLSSWRTLDVLENVESVIHRTVRMLDKAATPPHLRVVRPSASEVRIEYSSARRLCLFAVGICRGVAAHFGETITVDHPSCMLRGERSCLIVVRQSPPS